MKKKEQHPITDVYHVSNTLVDAATVAVTDLCENLSNSMDSSTEDTVSQIKETNEKIISQSESQPEQSVVLDDKPPHY